MNTKTLARRTVDFYAASNRLALAYRSAVRSNRNLARFAEMHELVPAAMAGEIGSAKKVVLSHVDDDPFVLTDERMDSLVSEGFHLLFTEPATHPDKIAQWMRRTNIRSENRLHVVRVDDLEDRQVSELLGRVCSALGEDGSRGSIVDAYLDGDFLYVRGQKLRMLHVPLHSLRPLSGRPLTVLENFEIDPDGAFLYWPDLDVHLGWHQFLQAVDPEELRKAQQNTDGYNRRYGAAIRILREEAGLSQSKINGLTERQLRRVEQGECRATKSALDTLAKAHGLDTNSYMEQLANAMK